MYKKAVEIIKIKKNEGLCTRKRLNMTSDWYTLNNYNDRPYNITFNLILLTKIDSFIIIIIINYRQKFYFYYIIIIRDR